jgi:hypothetical protein
MASSKQSKDSGTTCGVASDPLGNVALLIVVNQMSLLLGKVKRMAKLTQNAVLMQENGSIAYVRQDVGQDGKKASVPYDPITNAVVTAKRFTLTSLALVTTFISGFNAVPQKPRSGYDQYYNDDGPTNPASPRSLTTDGVLKNTVIFLNVLHERIAEGGAKGDEAAAALKLITEYNAVAHQEIAKRQKDSLMDKIRGNLSAEDLALLAAEMAKQGQPAPVVAPIAPPAATVEPSEAETEVSEAETPSDTLETPAPEAETEAEPVGVTVGEPEAAPVDTEAETKRKKAVALARRRSSAKTEGE